MIGATTHVECFKYNYDIIGHVVWQPRWKKGKTLDLCIYETTQRKELKLGTWQVLVGMCGFFKINFYDVIGALVMTS